MSEIRLWQCLEEHPKQNVAWCEWQDAFGGWDSFSGFERKFLQLTNQRASAVNCRTDCGQCQKYQPAWACPLCADHSNPQADDTPGRGSPEPERFNMYRTERGIFHSSQWQPESSQVSDRCICIISGRYTRAGFRWHGPFRHACWYQLERHHHQVY